MCVVCAKASGVKLSSHRNVCRFNNTIRIRIIPMLLSFPPTNVWWYASIQAENTNKRKATEEFSFERHCSWNSAAPPPRPLVISAPSHLIPTTTSAPALPKSLVRSAPSEVVPKSPRRHIHSHLAPVLLLHYFNDEGKKEITWLITALV